MSNIPRACGERNKGKQERSGNGMKREGMKGKWEKLNLLRLFGLSQVEACVK